MDLIVESNSDSTDICLEHDDKDWDIISKLGEGAYGKVYQAKKINGMIGDNRVDICAVKMIKNKFSFDLKEINCLKKIKGMNLAPDYYGYGKDKDGNIYIYMDYIEDSVSLSKYLESLPTKKIEDEECTKNYMAPEIFDRNGTATRKSDVYSLGCIMIDIVGGDVTTKVPTIPDHLSPYLKNTIQSCILTDFNARHNTTKLYYLLEVKYAEYLGARYKEIIKQGGVDGLNLLLKILSISNDINQPIELGSIPDREDDINQPIEQIKIPDGVRELYLKSFNYPITPGSILNNIEYLKLSSFNQIITPGSIDSVEFLHLPLFNQPITPGSIPNVVYLFLESFNQTITPVSLPDSLTVLCLDSFNIEFEKGWFPNSLTTLNLKSYNHPIKPDSIPKSVRELRIPSFNYPLVLKFPQLKKLLLGKFNQNIDYDNIPNVLHLNLGDEYNPVEDMNSSPSDSILTLESGYHYKVPMVFKFLPISVTDLSLTNYNISFTSKSFPKSVTSLTLGNDFSEFSSLYNNIPTNIINLKFNTQNFDSLNIDSIPKHVTSLIINDKIIR